jgi:hypothetical protein
VPRVSACTSLYEHKEATVMSSTCINLLLVVIVAEGTATIISY